MEYQNGPLRVTRSDTDYVFGLEIRQGSTTPVFSSGDLKEAVSQLLLDESKPAAFMRALEELQELGKSVDWVWEKITDQSE